MKSIPSWIVLLSATFAAAENGLKVDYKRLSIAALHEFGQLQSGQFGQYPEEINDEWVDHMGAFVTQSVTVGERVDINVGIGGLFQFQKREEISPAWGGSQTKYFFVGPTVADINYRRPTGSGSWSLGAGMFPFKYNPDASNLGEYLFRSGAYPTFVLSGLYSFVNGSTVFGLQGAKFNLTQGGFSLDALLLSETTLAPLYDLHLGAILKYTTPGGLLSVFGGANLKHAVPVRPSLTNKKTIDNAYFKNPNNPSDNTWYTGNLDYYRAQSGFYSRKYDEAVAAGADTTFFATQRDFFRTLASDSLRLADPSQGVQAGSWIDSATNLPIGAKFLSMQSLLLVAGGALDLKNLIGSEMFGPKDLRLFAEVAVLGVKNYEMFYNDITQRMPVMVGFNLPGFKLLDLISVQYEWFNSPWLDSYEPRGAKNIATPAFPGGTDRLNSVNEYNDEAGKDSHRWSVLVTKEVLRGLSVSAQAARDHIRSVSLQTYAGPGTDPNALLFRNKDWYWMVQIGLGI